MERKSSMSERTKFKFDDAKRIQNQLDIDFTKIDDNEFLMGLNVELEHGRVDPETNVTDDDEILTAKIALAHLREFPDYYTRLEELETKAEAYWDKQEK
jgi:hypothetical protein